ncbi:MAG: hypothetical protein MR878_06025 [Campylobacter sp.]|nr:hypothetical protein [Campylobacter sp.]
MNSRILKINGNSSIVVLVCQKPAVRTTWVEHEVHRAVRISAGFWCNSAARRIATN